MKNKTFWMALIALMLSLGTIAVIIMDVWPVSVIDSNSFISAMVALMTLVFTLIIGYQIYNTLDIKDKLKEVEELKSKTQDTYNRINYLKADVSDGIYASLAKNAHLDAEPQFDAFHYMNISLRNALDIDDTRDNYIGRIEDIERYALHINTGNGFFYGSSEEMIQKVNDYRKYITPIIEEIKGHAKYHIIKDRYDRLVKAIDSRLDKISRSTPASIHNIYEDLQ